jgi:hypothetical protein
VRNQELIDTGQRPGVSSTDHAELIAARKRIGELETELAVTKRANELLKESVGPKGMGGRHDTRQRRSPGRVADRDRQDARLGQRQRELDSPLA